MANKKHRRSNVRFGLPLLFILVAFIVLAYRFGERWLRNFLIYLSHSGFARDLVSGLSLAQTVARRFVAGESVQEAMAAAVALNSRGMMVTLDYLGESVTDEALAAAARDEIFGLFEKIDSLNINANVSVKLTQLGLRISKDLALDNLRQILTRAGQYGNKVRIDMEESALVDPTLTIYRRLRDEEGFNNVGVVIQSYLFRSESDVSRLIEEGAWVRLCKGAYAEPPDIAYADKADVDSNFVLLTKMMLSEKARQRGVYLAVATHDEKMIQATLDYVNKQHIPSDVFEFQMLYGIRRDLQASLVNDGYQMRVYVPYGSAWYPYFVRRLAERPANLWFFVSNLLRH